MSELSIPVLIPAYKPDARLVALCAALRAGGFPVLVVDDGGGEPFRSFFDEVKALGCFVEHHAVNLGKGRALKTGINAALALFPDMLGLVTADADGQHTPGDIRRVADEMRRHPGAMILGARQFTGNVPRKSRVGNAITRHVYRFVTGIRCHDTQTGLRALPAATLPDLLRLAGERYEYEMTMLLALRDLRIPLREVPIDTIYIDDNKGSHFSPLRDAARIYSVILRFLLSSILSFGVDYGLYLGALRFFPGFTSSLCYALARVISSLFNYTLNRATVFRGGGGKLSVVRYYLLAAVQLLVGSQLVRLLSDALGLGAGWVKIPVDTLLFFISFIIQRDFVFGGRKERKGGR